MKGLPHHPVLHRESSTLYQPSMMCSKFLQTQCPKTAPAVTTVSMARKSQHDLAGFLFRVSSGWNQHSGWGQGSGSTSELGWLWTDPLPPSCRCPGFLLLLSEAGDHLSCFSPFDFFLLWTSDPFLKGSPDYPMPTQDQLSLVNSEPLDWEPQFHHLQNSSTFAM